MGIKITEDTNKIFKSELDYDGMAVDVIKVYLYDYTMPIDVMLKRNAKECLSKDAYKNDDVFWFYAKVDNGAVWDIKLTNRWNEQLPINLKQYSKHFPFKYRDIVVDPEKLGNITFGYWGTCVGFSQGFLLNGGDFASLVSTGKLDPKEDKDYIYIGRWYYCVDFNDFTMLTY